MSFLTAEISLDSFGSGIKNITIEECQVIAFSSLGGCEKVSIISYRINHTLKLHDDQLFNLQYFNISDLLKAGCIMEIE